MTAYSSARLITELDALKAAVVGGSLCLFKTNVSLNSYLVAADLNAVEADFDGYAREVVPAALPNYKEAGPVWSFQIPTVQFDYGPAGAPPVGNTIFGAYILTAGGVLIQAFTLPAPVSMAALLDAIPIDLKFSKVGT